MRKHSVLGSEAKGRACGRDSEIPPEDSGNYLGAITAD